MASLHIPSREVVELTSYEEVKLDWLLQVVGDSAPVMDPVLDRVCELGIAGDKHYHQLPYYLGSTSMLTLDLREKSLGPRKVRQSILSKGTTIRHYLFDYDTNSTMLIERNIDFSPSDEVITDPMTPPLVGVRKGDLSKIMLGSGSEYARLVVEKAAHLDLHASPEAAAQFVADTDVFLQNAAVAHTNPLVSSVTYRFNKDEPFPRPE